MNPGWFEVFFRSKELLEIFVHVNIVSVVWGCPEWLESHPLSVKSIGNLLLFLFCYALYKWLVLVIISFTI